MISHNRPGDTRFARLIAMLVVTVSALVLASPASVAQDAATPAVSVSAADAVAQVTSDDGVIRFDVAENGLFFVWSGNPELVDGKPAMATPYATQGYIYPEGTLNASNGVLPDGSPEFPDQVIGHWSCYGWWIGDEAHAASSAPWLNVHLFNFGPTWGEAMLVSDGYSIDDLDAPLDRALTGGTGPFEGVTGTQVETNLGFNASGGLNFRHEVRFAGS